MEFNSVKFFFTRNPRVAPITRIFLSGINMIARNISFFHTSRMQSLNYLNVGCGKKIFKHTINLNYEWYPGIDIVLDITRKRLPLKDNQLLGIYSEHVLEHLRPHCLEFVLGEWQRVLKNGGIIRLVIPDAELYIDTYCKIKNGVEIRFPYHDENLSPIGHVNRIFRDYDHLYAFDFLELKEILEKAGYEKITQRSFMIGPDKNLLLDSDERKTESFYLEATVNKNNNTRSC